MDSKPNLKLLSFATIAVIAFLFAFSPAIFTSASNARVPLTSPFGNVKTHSVTVTGSHNVICKSNCTFVTNIYSSEIVVLSASGALINGFSTGGSSGYGAVVAKGAFGYKEVYVFDYSSGIIYGINPTTFTVVNTYRCTGCIFGVYVPTNKMIYISQFGYGKVIPFNAATGDFGTPISSCYSYPEYIAYNGKDKMVYTADRSNCYDVINPSTNIDTSFTIASASALNGAACDTRATGSGDCLITDTGNYNVYLVSGSTLISTFTGANYPWGDAFNPASQSGAGAFYVTSYGDTSVKVFSTTGLVTSISLSYGADANCLGPGKVVVNPLIGAGSLGYASGISKTYSLLWTTATYSSYPESCSIS